MNKEILDPESKAVLDGFNNKLKVEADTRSFTQKREDLRKEAWRKERNKQKSARKKLRG